MKVSPARMRCFGTTTPFVAASRLRDVRQLAMDTGRTLAPRPDAIAGANSIQDVHL